MMFEFPLPAGRVRPISRVRGEQPRRCQRRTAGAAARRTARHKRRHRFGAAPRGDGYTLANVEQCDDGNMSEIDSCHTDCTTPYCGDGVIWQGVEDCEDGNLINTDACTNVCLDAACGDGFLWQGMETCDDGNQNNGDQCPLSCEPAFCGDGFKLQGVEECDDGDDDDDDGCDTLCIASADPQCFLAYNEFTGANRNKLQVGGGPFCDQQIGNGWLGAGWYRFTGAAGTQMSETVIPSNMCATHASGWLNGVHPTLEDGIVSRQVCFNWSGNTCNWNAQIQVVACIDYYLYNLPNTPVCSLRYCGQN
jgi:cysteine-rich repeat protein